MCSRSPAGCVLRVVGGGLAIDAPSSDWLLLCTTLTALFLGFAKRRHEMTLLGEHAVAHRHVLGDYSPRVLDLILGIVTTAAAMSYALYTVDDETVHKFRTRALLFTFPFVLYGLLRYLYLVYERDRGGDPSHTLLTDVPTIANLCLWALVVGFILYR